MLSIGSKKEYFDAIWEKNEWSRFISFIQDKQDKYLIPCYFNMELKDLPIEFLPFEDMLLDDNNISKIVNRVSKLLNRNNKGSNQNNTSLISNLIERAKYCLNNSEFDKVLEIVENILNVDYKCAEAYFYNVLAKNKCKNEYDLADKKIIIRNEPDYEKALKFADEEYRNYLLELEQRIIKMAGEISNEKIYKKGKEYINDLKYDLAIIELRKINGYKDVDSLLEECYEKTYELAITHMERRNYDRAIQLFRFIINYKDSKYRITECEKRKEEDSIKNECNKICDGLDRIIHVVKLKGYFPDNAKIIYVNGLSSLNNLKKNSEYAIGKYDEYVRYFEELKAIEEEYIRKREEENRKVTLIRKIRLAIGIIVAFCIVLAIVISPMIISKNRKAKRYNQAVKHIENNEYSAAYKLLKELNYKDSKNLLKLLDAREFLEAKNYEYAIDIVYNLGGTTTVNYGSNTGTVDRNSDVIKKQYINNEATSIGKNFIGWDIASYIIDYKKYDLNLSLLAKYEDIIYNITYIDISTDMQDFVSLPQIYTYNEAGFLKIPDAIKKGYTFLGWSLNNGIEYKTDYEISTNLIGDISLTAHWKANKYTITLDKNGGPDLDITEYEVTQGESFTLPIPGEREGYTFVGYGSFFERGGRIYNNPVTNAQGESLSPFAYGDNVTYYALWEGKEYNVTIKVSGSAYITIPNSTPKITDDEMISFGEVVVKVLKCGDSITLECHNLSSPNSWYVDGKYVSKNTTFTFTVLPHDSVIELKDF